MTQHDPESRLRDMLDHGREALNLVRSIDEQTFGRDRVLQLAVVRLLEIVGEAATRTPEDVKAAHPTIPWRRITGLRNRLVHAYNTIDLEVVWSILQDDLPDLLRQLDAILGPGSE
jgi:uncharacterized protein with HEPN domain